MHNRIDEYAAAAAAAAVSGIRRWPASSENIVIMT